MDVHAAIGDERRLRRIVTLLVALAALAERVAAHSFPVRCLVLWILRRAETVAGEFVFEAAGMPPAVGGIATVGNGAEDARRLAARFRALAAALRALLPIEFRLDRRSARCGFAFGHGASRSGRFLGRCEPEPNDTS